MTISAFLILIPSTGASGFRFLTKDEVVSFVISTVKILKGRICLDWTWSHNWWNVEVPVVFDLRKEEAVMKLQLDEVHELPRSKHTGRFLKEGDAVSVPQDVTIILYLTVRHLPEAADLFHVETKLSDGMGRHFRQSFQLATHPQHSNISHFLRLCLSPGRVWHWWKGKHEISVVLFDDYVEGKEALQRVEVKLSAKYGDRGPAVYDAFLQFSRKFGNGVSCVSVWKWFIGWLEAALFVLRPSDLMSMLAVGSGFMMAAVLMVMGLVLYLSILWLSPSKRKTTQQHSSPTTHPETS